MKRTREAKWMTDIFDYTTYELGCSICRKEVRREARGDASLRYHCHFYKSLGRGVDLYPLVIRK